MKPLFIPKDKREFGLKVYCRRCDTLVFDTCKETNEPLEKCIYGDEHFLKVISYEKNSGKRRTKNLMTRDWKKGLLEAAIFQKQVKEGTNKEEKFQAPVIEKIEDSPLLIDIMGRHIAFLSGENVPEHKKHVCQEKHITQVSKVYQNFVSVLKAQHYPVAQLTASQIGDTEVGLYHKELKSKGVSGRTYDFKLGTLRTLYNFLRKENPTAINPFSGMVKQTRHKEVATITKEEFRMLEEKIQNNKSGKYELNPASEKVFYRGLLLMSIRLGLYSGRRLEELVMAKYRDCVLDETGNLHYLTVTDFKASRKQNRMDDPKKIRVPITKELNALLSPGLKKYRPDKFILDPDEKLSRKTIKSFITHSFKTHWDKLGIDKCVSFKTLRATHISHLANFLGLDRSRMITGHSGNDVLTKHYISQDVINLSVKGFQVFDDEKSNREKELSEQRASTNKKSQQKEIQIT